MKNNIQANVTQNEERHLYYVQKADTYNSLTAKKSNGSMQMSMHTILQGKLPIVVLLQCNV